MAKPSSKASMPAIMSHGPIPSLKWGEMTMEFKLGTAEQAKAIAPGDRVQFRFHRSGNDFVLDSIEKLAGEPKK